MCVNPWWPSPDPAARWLEPAVAVDVASTRIRESNVEDAVMVIRRMYAEVLTGSGVRRFRAYGSKFLDV
jgi:hypothetical protein